jgi:hypothetical protein
MKSDLKTLSQEVLAGVVERVTFHNEKNGFCVLRAKARGHRDLVTVVTQAASISSGEWITATRRMSCRSSVAPCSQRNFSPGTIVPVVEPDPPCRRHREQWHW